MKTKHSFLERQVLDLLPAQYNAQGMNRAVPTGDQGIVGERDDHSISGTFAERYEHLFRYKVARDQQWKKIVEVGCGTGYGSAVLASDAQITALDISKKAISYAAQVHPGPDYVVGSATALPLPDESVDAIVSFELIEHLTDPEKFLDECKRVLREDGAIMLSSPNPGYLMNLIKHRLLSRPIPRKISEGNIYHVREFLYDDMLKLLSRKGFEVRDTMGQTVPIPFAGQVFARLGLIDLYDWVASRLGAGFPQISVTVIYVAVKK